MTKISNSKQKNQISNSKTNSVSVLCYLDIRVWNLFIFCDLYFDFWIFFGFVIFLEFTLF